MSEQPSESPMIKPDHTGWLRERGGDVQHWGRRTLTAENFIAFLKTLAWVAPLTILIWIYAEREQVVTGPPVNFPIAVKSSDSTRIVRLVGDQVISATLEGPNAARQRVIDRINRPGEEPYVQVEIDRSFEPGRHTINTGQYLGRLDEFRTNGITVVDCRPAQLQFVVDELIEKDLPVRTPTSVTNLTSQAVFEPRTVKVRGPRAVLDDPRQTVTVEADLAGRDELRAPGPHEIAAVPLHLSSEDPSLTMTPTTVRATIDVGQTDVRFTIGSVPIWAAGPPGPPSLFEKYKAEYNPSLTNITLIGPPDKIETLKSKPPIATLYVLREDIGKGSQDRRVTLDLPEGVSVAKEDEVRLHVSFKLVELTPSE